MAENDLDLVRRGLLIENHFGWQDYNDLATKTTPLQLTLADTWYEITNDGLGPYSNKTHKIFDHKDIWKPATNSFDFSSLNVGDVVFLRLSAYIATSNANVNVAGKLRMAIGSAIEYDLPFYGGLIKNTGEHYITTTTVLYIGNTETRDCPAKVIGMADATGVSIVTDGWFITSLCRN